MSLRDLQPVDSSPLPAGQAAVVVCERQPRWAVAARQVLGSAQLIETRSLDDAWQTLQGAPYGVLIVDVEGKPPPQVVALLLRMHTELPYAMSIACVAEASAEWELLLREAGAALVLHAPYRLASVRAVIERHLARAPQRKLNFRERLWSRLPWPETASSTAPSGA